jgi:hypothetical protein
MMAGIGLLVVGTVLRLDSTHSSRTPKIVLTGVAPQRFRLPDVSAILGLLDRDSLRSHFLFPFLSLLLL